MSFSAFEFSYASFRCRLDSRIEADADIAGSPLNRLSFLRGDHAFLSSALKHPSARFVLLKDLAPLTKSPAEMYSAPYAEVRKLVPENFFEQSEENMIKNFDSRKTSPHLIFLGLDESRKDGGFAWKIYQGMPYFALDVTPRGSEEQQENAKGVISAMEAKGLSFFQTRVVMSFSAEQGVLSPVPGPPTLVPCSKRRY